MEVQIVPAPNGWLNTSADLIILQDTEGAYYYTLSCLLDIPEIERMYYTGAKGERILTVVLYKGDKPSETIHSDTYIYPCTIPSASMEEMTDVWRIYDHHKIAGRMTTELSEADPPLTGNSLWVRVAKEAIYGTDASVLEAVYDTFSYRIQSSAFTKGILDSSCKELSLYNVDKLAGCVNVIKTSWE